MPCWEVNTVSVEFKVKHKEILMTALKNLGYRPVEVTQNIISFNGITVDLDSGLADLRANDQRRLNEVKQEYSKVIVTLVAKKRKWALKQQKEKNKFILRRG